MNFDKKAPNTIDFDKEGLIVGLEFHQQVHAPYDEDELSKLHGSKLFCPCPSWLRDEEGDYIIHRKFRAMSGETGDVDISAVFEKMKQGSTIYEGYHDTTCLIELDEEPILPINEEALYRVLSIAKILFNLELVDEILVSRKTIIDGSNTSGFQRTALVAFGTKNSYIEVNGKHISIYQVNLEEDSAKNIGKEGNIKKYKLDRLGIPLIEIATGPDIRSPEEAKETALRIGELLRTTGFVKRGQGTIRQDLNVSIKKGTRIEIKGVSDLDLLTTYVTNESIRQVRMLEFLDILDKRGFELSHINKILSKDVSTLFVKCTAKFISKAIKNGDSVIAANLPYFNDLLGFELQPDYRVGTELSEICKVTAGLGGILHSDELPKFGISEDEVNAVRKQLKTKDTDGFILLVGKQNLCNLGIDGIKNVMKLWFEHKAIIPEVRSPKNNGTTGYLRPLPGKARMYPETDAKPIHLSKELLARIDSTKFEMPEERLNRYIKKIKLSKELADQMVLHPQNNLFEEIVNSYKVDANLVANTMLSTIINLRRDNFNVDAISENHLRSVFKLISLNEITKDAIEPILVEICKVGSNAKVENIISQLGIEKLDESEIEKVIDEVMSQHKDVISEKGMGAMGVLMGLIMNQFAGKADGKIVSGIIRKKIQNPK